MPLQFQPMPLLKRAAPFAASIRAYTKGPGIPTLQTPLFGIDLDFGNTVAEIRHDLYSLRFPRLFGTKIVHCDPLLMDVNLGPRSSKVVPIKANLFDDLVGVTPDFIKSITVEECRSLLDVYMRG